MTHAGSGEGSGGGVYQPLEQRTLETEGGARFWLSSSLRGYLAL